MTIARGACLGDIFQEMDVRHVICCSKLTLTCQVRENKYNCGVRIDTERSNELFLATVMVFINLGSTIPWVYSRTLAPLRANTKHLFCWHTPLKSTI